MSYSLSGTPRCATGGVYPCARATGRYVSVGHRLLCDKEAQWSLASHVGMMREASSVLAEKGTVVYQRHGQWSIRSNTIFAPSVTVSSSREQQSGRSRQRVSCATEYKLQSNEGSQSLNAKKCSATVQIWLRNVGTVHVPVSGWSSVFPAVNHSS